MKITKSQIKKLVKEVIETAMTNVSWTINDDIVTIEGLDLPDGRTIDADVEFTGTWDDGAFDYEYGSIKGTHRYEPQFSIEKYAVVAVRQPGTNDVIWQYSQGPLKTFDPVMYQEIEKYWSDIEKEVEQKTEPPEPDFDDRED